MKVGVLALQGSFREHREVLDALGADSVEVRTLDDIGAVDALVIPGGESTTMSQLLDSSGLRSPIAAMLAAGVPVLGTCAGAILLARDVLDGRPDQESFGLLDIVVRRNAYGRQRDSFEATLDVPVLGSEGFPGVFIRAPRIDAAGPTVEVLGTHDGHAVLVRRGPVWASTFHPELSGDLRLHQRFLQEVAA